MNIFTMTACSRDFARRELFKELIQETKFEEPKFFHWPSSPEQIKKTGKEGDVLPVSKSHFKRARQGLSAKTVGRYWRT